MQAAGEACFRAKDAEVKGEKLRKSKQFCRWFMMFFPHFGADFQRCNISIM